MGFRLGRAGRLMLLGLDYGSVHVCPRVSGHDISMWNTRSLRIGAAAATWPSPRIMNQRFHQPPQSCHWSKEWEWIQQPYLLLAPCDTEVAGWSFLCSGTRKRVLWWHNLLLWYFGHLGVHTHTHTRSLTHTCCSWTPWSTSPGDKKRWSAISSAEQQYSA